MKRNFLKLETPQILMLLLLLLGVAGWAAGFDPFMSSAGGLAMAILIRGPMDQLVTVKYIHTADTVSDTIYLLGGRVMLAMNSVLANAENMFLARGHIEYAKTGGEAWVGGQLLYWDDTAKSFTTTVGTNTKAGFAMEPAASADTVGQVFLEATLSM